MDSSFATTFVGTASVLHDDEKFDSGTREFARNVNADFPGFDDMVPAWSGFTHAKILGLESRRYGRRRHWQMRQHEAGHRSFDEFADESLGTDLDQAWQLFIRAYFSTSSLVPAIPSGPQENRSKSFKSRSPVKR